MTEALIFVVFPFCMAYAAISDLLSMRIANRVPLILVGSFCLIAPLTGMGWTEILWHCAAGAAVLGFGFAMFAIRAMGGGDAKLMAATSVWFGLNIELVGYLLTSVLLGGALTLLLLSFRKSPIALIAGNNVFLKHLADDKIGIPYGIALGIGGLICFSGSPLMIWALAHLAMV